MFCPLRTRQEWQCIGWKYRAALIAGALFDDTKRPLRTSCLAMYLVTQSKNGVATADLRRQLAGEMESRNAR